MAGYYNDIMKEIVDTYKAKKKKEQRERKIEKKREI
jgi:hypothetical protein